MASPASGPTNIGVAPNIGGLLCYVPCCIGFLFSIMVAIVEKQSRFVRFHAFQSLLLHGAVFVVTIGLYVVQIVLSMVHLGALGLLISLIHLLLAVALLGLSIFLMIKANSGEQFSLPMIGEMANKWAAA